MNFFLFYLTFSVFSREILNDEIDASETPVPITVSIKNDTKIQEVTNTILYSMTITDFTTLIEGPDKQLIPTVTKGPHIVYIPTILEFLKVVEAVPTATPVQITPMATQKLKTVLVNPGILIGCTFALVFLIGVIYTSCCRRPQPVRKNVKRSTKQRKENSDDFESAKRHRSKSRSAGGSSRHGSSHKSRSASGSRSKGRSSHRV